MTEFGEISKDQVKYVMPLTLRYMCPKWITFFGLGAVSAATMSSADSCILAGSSIFATNIYKAALRPKAGPREMIWVIRIAIVVVGFSGCLLSMITNSIFGLTALSSDLMYVILFPQLFCVIYLPRITNTYGAISGYFIGTLLRFGGGEEFFNFPNFIPYPGVYMDENGKLVRKFPVKTVAMVADFLVIIVISWLTIFLHRKGLVSEKMDIAGCFYKKKKHNEFDEINQVRTETVLLNFIDGNIEDSGPEFVAKSSDDDEDGDEHDLALTKFET